MLGKIDFERVLLANAFASNKVIDRNVENFIRFRWPPLEATDEDNRNPVDAYFRRSTSESTEEANDSSARHCVYDKTREID